MMEAPAVQNLEHFFRFGPGATRQSAEWKGYDHRQKCRQTPRTSQMGGRLQGLIHRLSKGRMADRESHVVPMTWNYVLRSFDMI